MTEAKEAFKAAVQAAHHSGEDIAAINDQVNDFIWNKHQGVPHEVKADVMRELSEEAAAHEAELLAYIKQRSA